MVGAPWSHVVDGALTSLSYYDRYKNMSVGTYINFPEVQTQSANSEPTAEAVERRALMASRQETDSCAHCGQAVAQLVRCSRCKTEVYCCKEHQVTLQENPTLKTSVAYLISKVRTRT